MRPGRGWRSFGTTGPTALAIRTDAVGKTRGSGGLVVLLWALAAGPGCPQNLEGARGKCGAPDATAATEAPDSSAGAPSNDPGCPATWTETNPAGDPAVCTTSGLICTYPEGQAECAPDGPTSKWWTAGRTPGCGETAPSVGAACGAPGLSCQYITGAPQGGDFTTSYCCDGTRCAWTLQGSTGCPNGNTCGSISTSDYDQSCSADADCVLEPQGDFCRANACVCATSPISVKAQAQYEADLASKVSVPLECPCALPPKAVCKQGRCALDTSTPPYRSSPAADPR